jgi:hypothetical protein
MKIAQSAVQGIGMSTKEIRGTWSNNPNHALAVSLFFTRATNQRIMLGTEPGHVLSTSLLYKSLLHDSRFMQVPVSRSAPGDIVVQSGLKPEGYAGIVVDHGRIVSDSSNRVRNNSSLVELQRRLPPTLLFRYIGVQKYPGYTLTTLANAGYNPDESRVPAGQPGGGQWTTGGAGAKAQSPQIAFGGRQATETEAVKALWAALAESIKAGGQHPTRAQLEQFSEAFDALQKYLVDHGMTPEEAFEAVNDAVRNLTRPGSGPNPGSEGVLGTYLGKPAGADIAQILAAAILGRSNVPDKGGDSKPPETGSATEKSAGDDLSGGKSLPTNEKGLTGGGEKNVPKDPSAASVIDKLQHYTLNPDHPDGRDKARWFKQALGYTRENAEGLAKQLVFDESKAVKTAVTPYGTKFNQTINVVGANGRTIPVKTAWIRGSDGVARLVTAVPGD